MSRATLQEQRRPATGAQGPWWVSFHVVTAGRAGGPGAAALICGR